MLRIAVLTVLCVAVAGCGHAGAISDRAAADAFRVDHVHVLKSLVVSPASRPHVYSLYVRWPPAAGEATMTIYGSSTSAQEAKPRAFTTSFRVENVLLRIADGVRRPVRARLMRDLARLGKPSPLG